MSEASREAYRQTLIAKSGEVRAAKRTAGDYSQKLKDPRWQKLRLKVFERDEFRCLCCQDEKETLHVHHLVYSKGEPWDAPMETLETLCATHHEWREDWNIYTGIRNTMPTRFIYAFFRLHHIYGGIKNKPSLKNHSVRFHNFWRCVGPEQWNPPEPKPVAEVAS